MQILESVFNVIFSITDYWKKSRDPILNEYRSHARNVLTFLFMSIFLLVLATFISPSDESIEGIAMISHYFSLGITVLAMIFMLATLWSGVIFYLFLRENGLWE